MEGMTSLGFSNTLLSTQHLAVMMPRSPNKLFCMQWVIPIVPVRNHEKTIIPIICGISKFHHNLYPRSQPSLQAGM